MTDSTPTILWAGQSGRSYTFWIYPIGTNFCDKPGNYVYSRQTQPGMWSPVYVGQTENLNDRLSNHEKELHAIRNGATHIHAHVNNGTKQDRLDEETDLIRRWHPVCNARATIRTAFPLQMPVTDPPTKRVARFGF